MIAVAWVLNLDAELELAAPQDFVASTRHRTRTAALGQRFLANAIEHGAVRHLDVAAGQAMDADICQAWCPTPRAQATAAAAGIDAPFGPALAVLQKVNHRRFAAELGIGLPGARFVRSMTALDEHLADRAPVDGWLLKRPFGFSGRGQKYIAGPLSRADRRWAEASMDQYGHGLQVEPRVATEAEFALHGWLGRDGTCIPGEPTCLATGAAGAWVGNTLAGTDLSAVDRRDFAAVFERVRDALVTAGYFGPFGIDGFAWRDGQGHRHFHALSEINARYTMGFFVGLDTRQPDLFDRIRDEQGRRKA